MPRLVHPKPRPRTPDQFLRDCGFRIYARPAKGEAVWERAGRLYPQSEAEAVAGDELAAALSAIESKWGGM